MTRRIDYREFGGVRMGPRAVRDLIASSGELVPHPFGLFIRECSDGRAVIVSYPEDEQSVAVFPTLERARAYLDAFLTSEADDEESVNLREHGFSHPLLHRMSATEAFERRDELLGLLRGLSKHDLSFSVDDLTDRISRLRRKKEEPRRDPWFTALSLYGGDIILRLVGGTWTTRTTVLPVYPGDALSPRIEEYGVRIPDFEFLAPSTLLYAGLRRDGYNGVRDAFETGALLRRVTPH
jgi:hypothetical protein